MNVASSPYPVSTATPTMDRGMPKADAASMQGAIDTRQENGRVMPAVNANLNLLASSSRNAATASETYQVVRGRGIEPSMTAHASRGAQSVSVMLESDRDWQRLGQNVDETV
jgi:hypothetical protein